MADNIDDFIKGLDQPGGKTNSVDDFVRTLDQPQTQQEARGLLETMFAPYVAFAKVVFRRSGEAGEAILDIPQSLGKVISSRGREGKARLAQGLFGPLDPAFAIGEEAAEQLLPEATSEVGKVARETAKLGAGMATGGLLFGSGIKRFLPRTPHLPTPSAPTPPPPITITRVNPRTGRVPGGIGKVKTAQEMIVNSVDEEAKKLQVLSKEIENLGKPTTKQEEVFTKMFGEGAEDVAKTGTLQSLDPLATTAKAAKKAARGRRKALREAGEKPETRRFRVSEEDVVLGNAKLVEAVRRWTILNRRLKEVADPLTNKTASLIEDVLEKAQKDMLKAVQRFRKQRFAAGRTVGAYREAIPEDVIAGLSSAGQLIPGLSKVKERLPIYTNLLHAARNWKTLTKPERAQVGKDLIDAWRLNLFAVHSFSLDLFGNSAEIAAQAFGAIGRDVVIGAKGNLTIPSIRGFISAFKHRLPKRVGGQGVGAPLTPAMEEALGLQTVGGEFIRGTFTSKTGAFTKRETLASWFTDLLVGSPLYAKGVMDTEAKRLAVLTVLWRDARIAARDAGVVGKLEKRAFYDRFMLNPPKKTFDAAVDAGNKAGFARDLTLFEEKIAASTTYRLVGAAFARWPFQFTRTFAEWLGWNKPLLGRVTEAIKKGKMPPGLAEDIGEYIGKTASGYGGLMLIDKLYDNVDFNKMEYVHPVTQDRTRLSNRDPIPTALWFLSFFKGHKLESEHALSHLFGIPIEDEKIGQAKQLKGARFASVPFASLASDRGGLLTSILKQLFIAQRSGEIPQARFWREIEDVVRRLIPGQAVLAAIETVMDPTIREGVTANLPVVSTKGIPGVVDPAPAAIERTTGLPLQTKQALPGTNIPLPTVAGGVSGAIPGARRLLDPVSKLLNRYGMRIYRGPVKPLGGVRPSKLDRHTVRAWEIEFGKHRNQLLIHHANRFLKGEYDDIHPDVMVQTLQPLDDLALNMANMAIEARKERGFLQPHRRTPPRVKTGPESQRFRPLLPFR